MRSEDIYGYEAEDGATPNIARSPCVGVTTTMLPSTDTALYQSVTVFLIGGLVLAATAPAVAATPAGPAVETATVVQDDEFRGVRLDSGEILFRNQVLYFNGAEVVNNASIAPVSRADAQARTFEIRRVDNGAIGSSVEEFQVDQRGIATINTAGYEPDEYVIVYEGNPIALDDGDGEFVSAVDAASFEVAVQNLTASFDPDQVDLDESTALELESNREEYLVTIDSPGLQTAQVNEMVEDEFENSSVRNGTILRITDGDVEMEIGDVPVDPGVYEFNVSVLGSEASDTATLTYGDGEQMVNETGDTGTGTDAGTPDAGGQDLFTDESGNETEMPVEDTPTATPTPEQTPSPTPDVGTTTTETGPGFGLLAALVGLLGAGLLARRRSR